MNHEPSDREQRHRKHQGWQFTFFGETLETQGEEKNRAEITPDLLQSGLESEQVFPLSTTQIGDRVVINQILSGKSMVSRLSQMGLTLGSEVQVISKTTSGSIIFCIQDEQIGLGAGIANRVMVTCAEGKRLFKILESRRATMDRSNDNERQHRHQEGNYLEEAENHPQKRFIIPLAKAQVGAPRSGSRRNRLWIAGYESKEGINRLVGMGLAPGMAIEIIQNLAGNLLVAIGETRIGIDGEMAKRILVSDKPFDYLVEVQEVNEMENSATTLRDLQVNQQAKVARFEATDDPTQKAYKRKLLAMGLTPGTEFTVTRVAPLGDPVEILVRGFKLSLRKDEAAVLVIEPLL